MEGDSLSELRIVHVHTLPVVSGSGINTLLTMQGSQKCGARVGLAAAPGGSLEDLVRQSDMEFFPIRHFVSELAPSKDLHALWQLDRLMARERFDIVHTHNSKAGFLGRLAVRLNRGPVLIHTVHGFAFHDEESLLCRRMFVLLERMAARWCHQMIVIFQPMMDWAEQENIASREQLVKIYSGIQVEEFRDQPASPELRQKFGIQPDQTVMGLVSKLWKGKGHEVLIEAVSLLVERGFQIKLLIVGEETLELELKKKVQQQGLQDVVVFTGFWSNVPEITAILDIFVLPSFYEGMGRVVLEAMAAGKPVVASGVGGLTELVKDEVTGYLVPAGDVEALAERLEKLISDPDLRRRMGEQGARHVQMKHSSTTMVEMIHQVYQQQLELQKEGTSHY